MGRFVMDKEIAKQIEADEEKSREQQAKKVRDQAEYEGSMANASPELQKLKK